MQRIGKERNKISGIKEIRFFPFHPLLRPNQAVSDTECTSTETPFGDLEFIDQKKKKKVLKLVNKYNLYARLWGFEPMDYDESNLLINNIYLPKLDDGHLSWYKMFQTHLQNLYMNHLWDRIWNKNFKLCYK